MQDGIVYGKTADGVYRVLRTNDDGALLIEPIDYLKLLGEAVVALTPSTIVDDGSGNVTGWNNTGTGGSLYSLTQKTGAVRVGSYAGRKTAEIVDGGDLATASIQHFASGRTVLIVGRRTINAADQYWWGSANNSLIEDVSYFCVNWRSLWRQIQGTSQLGPATTADLELHVVAYTQGSGRVLYFDGAEVATTAIDANSIWDYGCLGALQGGDTTRFGGYWIGEFYVWDRKLDADEVATVSTYLKDRWTPTAELAVEGLLSDSEVASVTN